METSSTTTFHFENMASPPDAQHNFLKMEDLHHTTSASPSPSISIDNTTQDNRPVVIVHSKAAKKRKSWGQELPEPKTALPPRKRAKTDDEKEQRRIERIKRNRAAAHNSRERKRQEAETLAVLLAKANAELNAYRQLHGPLPSHIVLPEVEVCIDGDDTPLQPTKRDSVITTAQSPASPPVDSLFDSDCGTEPPVIIKQEPDVTFHNTFVPPTIFELPEVATKKEASTLSLPLLDPTQHSAEMLCDLQCRSRQQEQSSQRNRSHFPRHPMTTPSPANVFWTSLFLHLMTLHFTTTYKTLLLALWTHSPSRMALAMRASLHRLTSRSTTTSTTPRSPLPRLLLPPYHSRSMAAALAQHSDAATRLAVGLAGRRRQGAYRLTALQLQNGGRVSGNGRFVREGQLEDATQHQGQSVDDSRAFNGFVREESMDHQGSEGVGR